MATEMTFCMFLFSLRESPQHPQPSDLCNPEPTHWSQAVPFMAQTVTAPVPRAATATLGNNDQALIYLARKAVAQPCSTL